MDSGRIPRHANGVTAWTEGPVFSGISERTAINGHFPCLESRHGGTAPGARSFNREQNESDKRRGL